MFPPARLAAALFLSLALLPLLLSSCERPAGPAGNSPPQKQQQALRAKPTPGFVTIKAGSFLMGSDEDERGRYTNEWKHEVVLTRDFELSPHETTQRDFAALMGRNPSHFSGCPACPVEMVSWHEAAAYANALSKKHGLAPCYACSGAGAEVSCEVVKELAGAKIYDCPGFRLPTDAEWEYAYRAGTKTTYYNGTNPPELRSTCAKLDALSDEIGWYCVNSEGKTHPVGGKKPNAWGLYDLAGNVWEWCHDRYHAVLGAERETDPWGIADSPMVVVRGGAWKYFSRGMRAANRAWFKPAYRSNHHGFRVARSLMVWR